MAPVYTLVLYIMMLLCAVVLFLCFGVSINKHHFRRIAHMLYCRSIISPIDISVNLHIGIPGLLVNELFYVQKVL